MRILHFGTYSTGEGYPRNSVVARGLKAAGATVGKCHRPLWHGPSDKVRGVTSLAGAISAALRFTVAWAQLIWDYLFNCPPHDLVIVGYPGHLDVFLARVLATLRGKPVVLDAFLSLYEAVIEDRKLASPSSLRAKALRFLDRASSKAAHAVLLDTEEHIKYYRDSLGIDHDRFLRVFVGGEDDTFYPIEKIKENDKIQILFFGSFLPLHGVDVIIEAFRHLDDPDIHLTLAGDGPEWESCKTLADGMDDERITWIRRWVHYDELVQLIAGADICLGIFSGGGKASRVIPCKVFNVLAMGRPLITADTPAVREALENNENACLVPAGNPEALAEAIRTFKYKPEMADEMARAGLEFYRKALSQHAIGRQLFDDLNRLFGPFD